MEAVKKNYIPKLKNAIEVNKQLLLKKYQELAKAEAQAFEDLDTDKVSEIKIQKEEIEKIGLFPIKVRLPNGIDCLISSYKLNTEGKIIDVVVEEPIDIVVDNMKHRIEAGQGLVFDNTGKPIKRYIIKNYGKSESTNKDYIEIEYRDFVVRKPIRVM